jgi:hypothetical protein
MRAVLQMSTSYLIVYPTKRLRNTNRRPRVAQARERSAGNLAEGKSNLSGPYQNIKFIYRSSRITKEDKKNIMWPVLAPVTCIRHLST